MTILCKTLIASLFSVLLLPVTALADEGGASFWLPGQFGSFAAVQSDPGWSLAGTYFYSSTDADKTFTRGKQITIGLDVRQDLLFLTPTYVFAEPIWGAQASISLTAVYGRVDVELPVNNVTLSSLHDNIVAFGDLYPQAALRWNDGNGNYMVYAMGGIPAGKYDPSRLASVGSNHWAADFGGAYTYLNMESGMECSVTAGLTYSWKNPDTDYRNGIDGHVDWAASYFLSDSWNVGLNGYFFHQFTGDSGSGAKLGDFKSRVNGVGPQINRFFPFGKSQGVISLKGYREFGADHRTEGWNSWLTLSVPLGAGD